MFNKTSFGSQDHLIPRSKPRLSFDAARAVNSSESLGVQPAPGVVRNLWQEVQKIESQQHSAAAEQPNSPAAFIAGCLLVLLVASAIVANFVPVPAEFSRWLMRACLVGALCGTWFLLKRSVKSLRPKLAPNNMFLADANDCFAHASTLESSGNLIEAESAWEKVCTKTRAKDTATYFRAASRLAVTQARMGKCVAAKDLIGVTLSLAESNFDLRPTDSNALNLSQLR